MTRGRASGTIAVFDDIFVKEWSTFQTSQIVLDTLTRYRYWYRYRFKKYHFTIKGTLYDTNREVIICNVLCRILNMTIHDNIGIIAIKCC